MILYGRAVGAAGKEAGQRPYAADYSYLSTMITSQIFTAVETAWYRFYVVGRGGNGGNGGGGKDHYQSDEVYYGSGGGGGGAGGYAVHELLLRQGETAEIVIDEEKVQLLYGSQTVTAENGGNGGNGRIAYAWNFGNGISGGAGGSGGKADGGNVINITGTAGRAGSGRIGNAKDATYAAGGDGGDAVPGLKYHEGSCGVGGEGGYNPKSPDATRCFGFTASNRTQLGAAGGGGAGHGATKKSSEADGSATYEGGMASAGYMGGVVIEKAPVK